MCYDRDPFLGDVYSFLKLKKSMEITVFLNKDFYKRLYLKKDAKNSRKQKAVHVALFFLRLKLQNINGFLRMSQSIFIHQPCLETKPVGSDRRHK